MDKERQRQKEMLSAIVKIYKLTKEQMLGLLEEVYANNGLSNQLISVGWYVFEGGKCSPAPNAYPNLQGVVAWVNPDPNAPIGQRGLILMPDEVTLKWADEYCETVIRDEEDGQGNTKSLIAYGKEHGVCFPAAEWCSNYSKNGVKPGEGFLPATHQLERIFANKDVIDSALKKIGADTLVNWLLSSSDYGSSFVWGVNIDTSKVGLAKMTAFSVRCVIAF